MNDKNDKEEHRFKNNKDYKDKGKKSYYISKEEHTKLDNEDDNDGVEVVCVAIK